jgi:hypothetical protein
VVLYNPCCVNIIHILFCSSSAEITVSFKKFNIQQEDFSMKPRITVITLGVNDLEKAVEFYRDGLGFPTE